MSERNGGSWSKAFYRGFLDGLAAPTLLGDTSRQSRKYAERDRKTERITVTAHRVFNGIYQEIGPRSDGDRREIERQGKPFRKVGK